MIQHPCKPCSGRARGCWRRTPVPDSAPPEWPSCKDWWTGSDPVRTVSGMCTSQPSAMPALGIETPGSPPRHGHTARIGTGDPRAVAQPQADRRLAESAFRTLGRDFPAQAPRCRFHTSGSATGSPERRSNPDSAKAARTPDRMGVDRASRTRRSKQFPHLGDPAEAGLKAAHVRNRLAVHAEDGALDARDLAPRRRSWADARDQGPCPHWSSSRGSSAPGRAVSGRTRPRWPPPTSHPPSEPPVPVPPRVERRRGVVAGIGVIGVDEHGAAGVQRHGHPAREVAPRAPDRAPVDPDGHQGAVDAESLRTC